MDRGRQNVGTRDEPVELRFDDEVFIQALKDDDNVPETDTQVARPLAQILGVERAIEFDFGYLVDARTVLTARPGRTAAEADRVYDDARREKGDGVQIAAVKQGQFASWVLGVTCDNPAWVPYGTETRKLAERAAAFGALPEWLAPPYRARVRAHEDRVNAPPRRDPAQTAPKETAPLYSVDGSS